MIKSKLYFSKGCSILVNNITHTHTRARCHKWVLKRTGDNVNVGRVLIESRTCLCSDSAGVVRMCAPDCVIITSSAAGHSGECVRVCVCDLLSRCYCWITERGCVETQTGEESTRPEPNLREHVGAGTVTGNGECVGGWRGAPVRLGVAHRQRGGTNALVLKKKRRYWFGSAAVTGSSGGYRLPRSLCSDAGFTDDRVHTCGSVA